MPDLMGFIDVLPPVGTNGMSTRAHSNPNILRLDFNRPAPNPIFAGREKELKQLRRIVRGGAKTAVLYGLGGMGKSQIVAEFITRFRSDYDAVFWVNAGTAEAMEADFKGISRLLFRSEQPGFEHVARALDLIDDNGRFSGDNVAAVTQWLSLPWSGKWILVFDSLDDPHQLSAKYLPQRSLGTVVITSRVRNSVHFTSVGDAMEITELSEEAGSSLLLKKVTVDVEMAESTGTPAPRQ
jgi:hypothetical protein